jgi:hypothetical protein
MRLDPGNYTIGFDPGGRFSRDGRLTASSVW